MTPRLQTRNGFSQFLSPGRARRSELPQNFSGFYYNFFVVTLGSFLEPVAGLGYVLCCTFAEVIHRTAAELGPSNSLFSSFFKPIQGFRHVYRRTIASAVQLAALELGLSHPLFGGFFDQIQGFFFIYRCALAVIIHHTT